MPFFGLDSCNDPMFAQVNLGFVFQVIFDGFYQRIHHY